MNSVKLANKVWDKVKRHSVLPTPELLAQFVQEEPVVGIPELRGRPAKEVLDAFVILNAIRRIQEKIDEGQSLLKRLQEAVRKGDKAQEQEVMKAYGVWSIFRFKEK